MSLPEELRKIRERLSNKAGNVANKADEFLVSRGMLYPKDVRGNSQEIVKRQLESDVSKGYISPSLLSYGPDNRPTSVRKDLTPQERVAAVQSNPIASNPLNRYALNQVILPFSTGSQSVVRGKNPLEKGMGALSVAGSVIQSTPGGQVPGILFNAAFGTTSGGLKTITQGGNIFDNIQSGITKPSGLSESLGLQDKTVNIAGNEVPIAPFVDIAGLIAFTKGMGSLSKAKDLRTALKSFESGDEKSIVSSMNTLMKKYPKEFNSTNLTNYKSYIQNTLNSKKYSAIKLPDTRPKHQRLLEDAANKGDFKRVGKILDSIPENDPYKSSMESLFRSRVPQPTPAEKLIAGIKKAEPIREQQELSYTQERSSKFKQLGIISSEMTGEEALNAKLKVLQGSFKKVKYKGISSDLTQQDVTDLFEQINKTDRLTEIEKVPAGVALRNLLNSESVPTRSELKLLKEVFPEEMISAVLDMRTRGQKLLDAAGNILNIPRSAKATGDLSAPLRQGLPLIGSKAYWKSFGTMFKSAFSEKSYQNTMNSIKQSELYPEMRAAGVSFTDLGSDLTKREEAIMSNIIEKTPIVGRFSKASNRAYVSFLNKLRHDTFASMYKDAQKLGVTETRPNVSKEIAKWVNNSTGRGDLGKLEESAQILNGLFFSPRLMASRINMLNPIYYVKMDPFVRKKALDQLLRSGSVLLSIMSAAKLAGADVETNPKSSDFLKMKFGNTRIDMFGGFQQYLVAASRLLSGRSVSSSTGREVVLGEGYKPLTRADIATKFLRNKLAPIPSFIVDMMSGSDGLGKRFDVPSSVIDQFIPMFFQDLYDLGNEYGFTPKTLAKGIPGLFGAGSQTYGKEYPRAYEVNGNIGVELRGSPTIGESISRTAGNEIRKLRGVATPEQRLNDAVMNLKPIDAKGQDLFNYLKSQDKSVANRYLEYLRSKEPKDYSSIQKMLKLESLGLPSDDISLQSLGVKDGKRAQELFRRYKEAGNNRDLLNKYIEAGLIDKEVFKQIKDLMNE